MIDCFFGNLNAFQIIVAVVAFLTGAHTLYAIIAKPKLKIYLTDTIGIVISPGEVTHKFHLGCNLINPTSKVGALHKLEAIVVDPNGKKQAFYWNLFFEYEPGGTKVRKSSDPYPIAVPPRSSVLHFVEFITREDKKMDSWPEGRYEFTLHGWVNRPSRKSSPNMKATFHVEFDEFISMCTVANKQSVQQVLRVPIIEWTDTHL